MKQFFVAGSFAILALITYGVNTGPHDFAGKHAAVSFQNLNDTTPKLDTNPHMKKDTMRKKKFGGKDSLLRRDSLRPIKDTTNH